MTRRLLFLLGQTEREIIRWAIADGSEVLDFGAIEGVAGLAAVAPYAGGVSETVALLPGEQVASRRMATAPRSGAKLRAAAAYLMEDELAESTELLQVGAGSIGSRPVAFAARTEIIRGWRAAFKAAAIDLDVITADYLALSCSSEEATIIEDRGRVIAGFESGGCTLEKDLFRALAPGLFERPLPRFVVFGDDALCAALPEGSATERRGPSGDALLVGVFARALNASVPPNFLQRSFFQRKQLASAFGPWRRAAALAAAFAGAGFLTMIADGTRLARSEARWMESVQDLHQQRFPEAASENPVEYARKRLAAGGDDASFLTITSRIAAAVASNDAVRIDRIRFESVRGDYLISIRSNTDSAIVAFKADLARAGIAAAESGGFRKSGGFWSGDLKVRFQ